jgi:separase
MVAGCPAVVANLWDVTDRDIDRFSRSLLNRFLGGGGGEGGAVPGHGGDEGAVDTSAAVATCRSSCRLRHLIGAAPVCYGIPTVVAAPGQLTAQRPAMPLHHVAQ